MGFLRIVAVLAEPIHEPGFFCAIAGALRVTTT